MQIRKTALALSTAAAIIAGTAFMACGNDSTVEPQTAPDSQSSVPTLAPVQAQALPTPSPTQENATVSTNRPATSNDQHDSREAHEPGSRQTLNTRVPATATPAPATPTPTPATVTPTSPVHTQSGGSVIMQAPTSTPTPPPPPTPTATPVPGPYWETFSQADYDQFLPPKGPIQWPGRGMCDYYRNEMTVTDATTDGIKSRIQWVEEDVVHVMTRSMGDRTMDILYDEHPDRFKENLVDAWCGYMEVLDPNVPVVRVTLEFFVRSVEGWKNERGSLRYEWDSYRVEARYVVVDNPELRAPYLRLVLTQLGPILIEKMNSPCDRTSVRVHPDTYCQKAP